MKKIIIGFLIFILAGISNIQAIYVNPKLEKIYKEKVVLKIDKKYSDLEKKIKVLENLGEKIEKIKKLKKYKNNKKVISLLDQFLYLNNYQIKKYKKILILKKINQIKEQKNLKKVYDDSYLAEINTNKKIIDNYDYSKYFKKKIYSNNFIVLENGIWYSYYFDNITYFDNDNTIQLKDLQYNNIDLNNALLFVRDKKKLGIIKKYSKKKLITDNIIKNIYNKYYFLEILKEDKRKIDIDYDDIFLNLREETEKIIYNSGFDLKVSNIYNYILNNIKYSEKVDFTDYRQFSGIETYKNKQGVCSGYTKLMVYMLLFSGINDVKEIQGYVIDAIDFPEVGHSWVKVGNKYYDPTFDDPIGLNETRKADEYKYFGLPKDLFYSNRYNKKELPDSLKNLSLDDRKKLILKNLYILYPKYKDKNYNILKEIKFRIEHNIRYDEVLNFEMLDRIMKKYVVNNFAVIINGQKKYITSLRYYNINKTINLNVFFGQIDYNIDGYYFFEWYDKDGNKSYKIAYDVVFR